MNRDFVALATLLCLITSNGYAAVEFGPVAGPIEDFDRALLSAMTLSQGRTDALLHAVEQTFDFSVMAQFLVGVPWGDTPASEQALLVTALKRYTAARLARRFDRFANQQFIVDPTVLERGPDRVVKTQLLAPGDAPVHIDYRMREYDGLWKVIDVYSDGVSLLSTERADVSSTLDAGGTAALVTRLQQAAEQLR